METAIAFLIRGQPDVTCGASAIQSRYYLMYVMFSVSLCCICLFYSNQMKMAFQSFLFLSISMYSIITMKEIDDALKNSLSLN